jgi:hypothetical protein
VIYILLRLIQRIPLLSAVSSCTIYVKKESINSLEADLEQQPRKQDWLAKAFSVVEEAESIVADAQLFR